MAKRTKNPLQAEEKRSLNKKNFRQLIAIFRFIRPYKGWFAIGLISLVLSSVMLLGFPYLAGALLDVASGKPVLLFSSINEVTLALLAILFLQGVFSFIRVYTFSFVSEHALADVRTTAFKKMVWLPMSFYDNRRVGELMSRLTADVGILSEMFSLTLAELLRQGLTLLLGIPIILYLTPKLTGFMLLTFPVLVILAIVFGKYIRQLSKKTQDKSAEANVIVEETLHSISVVKAFTNEAFEIFRYGSSLSSVVQTAIRTARFRGLFISFIIFALFGGIVGVGWYGALLVQSGTITIGELFSFIFYTSFIGASIGGLGDIYSQIQRSIGASERILEILQEEDEASSTGTHPIKLKGEIEFRNLNFNYPSRTDYQVLKNLNFKIGQGEKVALVGESGAGKSTIISLIMRFYPIKDGSILVDGDDINKLNLFDYRHNIGIVPQEVLLFGGSILENIRYGKPSATIEEVRQAAHKANALEFIERFPEGFETLVGDRGIKLSGGQRQRVAIARTILKDPSILILDEATSSLDAHAELLVQEALEKLMEGRTTLIIAHRLSTIKKVDRIFVIKDGTLAETGSHTELTSLDNGLYNTLLTVQLQG